MAVKLIPQDLATLQEAYEMRLEEYKALRAASQWQGAVLHSGFLLELALKIAICKHLDEPKLPRIFQVHDLELLFYCSGLRKTHGNYPVLQRNLTIVVTNWSLDLRYEKHKITQGKADKVHQALFDVANGLLTFLSTL